MSNSGFLITDAGLAAASAATPQGPYIHITNFKVASGYNYTPTRAQTALVGTVLHESAPTAYSILSDDTVQVLLLMGSELGTFEFGEIGLYLADGTLFAVCVFSTLQEKVRAVGAQAGNTWKIKSLLKLAQAPAIVEITLINSQGILEVPNWQLLAAPLYQPSSANVAIVHDNDSSGNPVFVVREADLSWGLIAYGRVFSGNSSGSGISLTGTTFTHPDIASIYLEMPNTTSDYLVKFPDGQIRKITGQPSGTSISWTPAIVPSAGLISIWNAFSKISNGVIWADTAEYNELVTSFNPYWATPSGTYSATNKGLNQTALPVLSTKVTPAHWAAVLNAMRAVSNIVAVSTAPLAGITDFTYLPGNPARTGLSAVRKNWDETLAHIGRIETNRNVVNLGYQTVDAYPDKTYSTYWNGIKNHTFAFTYSSTATALAHFNSGNALTVTPTVTGPSTIAWTTLQTLFASLGPITITPTATTAAAGWSPATTIGLQNLTSSYVTIASYTSYNLYWSIQVYARRIGNVVSIVFSINAITNNGYGYGYGYGYTSPGVIHFNWAVRHEAVLASPALAIPSLTYTA